MRRAVPLLLLPLLACQDYLFEQQCREVIRESELSIPEVKASPVDILFIVDDSGSMADEQQNLAQNFDRFLEGLAAQQVDDYRIAVVTTDLDTNGGQQMGSVQFDWLEELPYTRQDQNLVRECAPAGVDHGCFRGGVVASSRPQDEQLTTFRANVDVGTCGSGNETGLAAMVSALQQTGERGCNAGFLREEANLILIFVSDEDDAGGLVVQQHLESLKARKPLDKVRVATIVGAHQGGPADCRIDPATGGSTATCGSLGEACTGCDSGGRCDDWCRTVPAAFLENAGWCSNFDAPDCCSALPGSRYVEFAQAFEAEVRPEQANGCSGGPGAVCLVDSICQDNFGETLARIARDLASPTTFTLDPPALFPEGISVQIVDEQGQTENLEFGVGFSVSADGRTLDLTEGLQTGERLDIFFVSGREDSSAMPKGACPP